MFMTFFSGKINVLINPSIYRKLTKYETGALCTCLIFCTFSGILTDNKHVYDFPFR